MDELKMPIKLDMVRIRATLDARTCAHCAACDGRAIRASEMSDHFASCEHVKAGGRDQACRCVFTLIADPTDAALALEIAGIDEIRDHLMRVLKAFPPKLTPNEVTEPGWYCAKDVTGEIECVRIAQPERGDFALVALVIDDRVGVGWPLAEFAWFIGPLVPPTVE